jgi:hypothetical protein
MVGMGLRKWRLSKRNGKNYRLFPKNSYLESILTLKKKFMTAIPKRLTNLQLELIKYFSYDVSENEMLDIKKMLSEYFAKRVMDRMDNLWEKNDWSDDTMEEWLNADS